MVRGRGRGVVVIGVVDIFAIVDKPGGSGLIQHPVSEFFPKYDRCTHTVMSDKPSALNTSDCSVTAQFDIFLTVCAS